jgi:hypothetical protein
MANFGEKYYVDPGKDTGPCGLVQMRFVQTRLKDVEMEIDVLKSKVATLESVDESDDLLVEAQDDAAQDSRLVDMSDEVEIEDYLHIIDNAQSKLWHFVEWKTQTNFLGNVVNRIVELEKRLDNLRIVKANVKDVAPIVKEEDSKKRVCVDLPRTRTYYKLSDVDYERPCAGLAQRGTIIDAVEDFIREEGFGLPECMDSGLTWYKKKCGHANLWPAGNIQITAKGSVLIPKRQVVDFDYRMIRAFKYQKLSEFGYKLDHNSIGMLDIDGVWHEFVSDLIAAREGEKYKNELVQRTEIDDRNFISNISSTKFPSGWKRDTVTAAFVNRMSEERLKMGRQLHSEERYEIARQVQKEALEEIETIEEETRNAVIGKRKK